MASKKLEEKHQKILHDLLRQAGNRRCFVCTERGPQYACMTFNTFVCTTCSGIHREFSHRVKGISMSTFSPEEIKTLENGGNDKAREVWLAKWRPRDFVEPEAGDKNKIRDYIRAVFVDKRWFSENWEEEEEKRKKREKKKKEKEEREHKEREEKEKEKEREREREQEKAKEREARVKSPKHISSILGDDVPPLVVQEGRAQQAAKQAPGGAPTAAAANLLDFDGPTTPGAKAFTASSDLELLSGAGQQAPAPTHGGGTGTGGWAEWGQAPQAGPTQGDGGATQAMGAWDPFSAGASAGGGGAGAPPQQTVTAADKRQAILEMMASLPRPGQPAYPPQPAPQQGGWGAYGGGQMYPQPPYYAQPGPGQAPMWGPQMGGPQMGGPQMGGPQMGGPQMGGPQMHPQMGPIQSMPGHTQYARAPPSGYPPQQAGIQTYGAPPPAAAPKPEPKAAPNPFDSLI